MGPLGLEGGMGPLEGGPPQQGRLEGPPTVTWGGGSPGRRCTALHPRDAGRRAGPTGLAALG